MGSMVLQNIGSSPVQPSYNQEASYMTDNKENRTILFRIRLTPKEYETLKKNAAKSGLTMSEYGRRSLIGEKIVEAPPADLYNLIREVKRVGSNLNQVLKKLNVLGIAHSLELDRCAEDIREAMHAIYQTYRPGKGDE